MKFHCNHKLNLNSYNTDLMYKKSISFKNYALLKWAVFSKQVFPFETQGFVSQVKNKTGNQSVTVQAVVSRNTVYICASVQSPAILAK